VKTTDFEFGKGSVIRLIVKHCNLILNCKENLDIKILQSTLISYLWLLKKSGRVHFRHLVNHTLQDHHFQETSIPLDIFATFQASNVDFEHGFRA
jgi:hypothetical protein